MRKAFKLPGEEGFVATIAKFAYESGEPSMRILGPKVIEHRLRQAVEAMKDDGVISERDFDPVSLGQKLEIPDESRPHYDFIAECYMAAVKPSDEDLAWGRMIIGSLKPQGGSVITDYGSFMLKKDEQIITVIFRNPFFNEFYRHKTLEIFLTLGFKYKTDDGVIVGANGVVFPGEESSNAEEENGIR